MESLERRIGHIVLNYRKGNIVVTEEECKIIINAALDINEKEERTGIFSMLTSIEMERTIKAMDEIANPEKHALHVLPEPPREHRQGRRTSEHTLAKRRAKMRIVSPPQKIPSKLMAARCNECLNAAPTLAT